MPEEKSSFSRAIAIGIFVAVGTAVLTYAVNLIDEHRKRKIDFVNRQIEKLYGPLYVLSAANRRGFSDLAEHYAKGEPSFFSGEGSPEKVEAWRRWMKSVLMPINIKMENAILDNFQLIEGAAASVFWTVE